MEDGANLDPLDADRSDKPQPPLANETWQKRWRIAGGVTVIICAAMAAFGVDMQMLRDSTTLFLVYWGVFTLLFFATLYIVALDMRYIRAQHAIEARDLFQETLGDHEFRDALNEAVRSASNEDSKNDVGKTHEPRES